MSKGWEGGSTRKWRRIRLTVLRRDGYVCQLRILGICTYKATHVHHIKGKKFGDDPAWLVAACMACNLHVGDPTTHYDAGTSRPPIDPEPRPTRLLD